MPSANAHLMNTGFGPFHDGPTHLFVTPEDLLSMIALALLAGSAVRASVGLFSSLYQSPGWCNFDMHAAGRPVWWGEAPFWLYEINEAGDVLIANILLGRKPRRAGVCSAAADKRAVGPMYVPISRFPSNVAAKR